MTDSDLESDDEDWKKALARYPGTRPRDVNFLEGYKLKATGIRTTASGLQYRVCRGPESDDSPRPSPDTLCRVHYRGLMTDGKEFDSTYRRRLPALLKPNELPSGWGEAMTLMQEGEKWEIIIPAHLGYGRNGAGPVPPGAVLILELELLEVDAEEKEDTLDFKFPAAFGIIMLGLLLALYLHFSRAAPGPRGRHLSVAEVSSVTNPRVFFDIEAGGKPLGRIEFELFAQTTPRTAENFRALATGELGISKETGTRLHFKGSPFHRIIPGYLLQGGDIHRGDGHGGESIFGRYFEDEWKHAVVIHDAPGLLSMANKGKNTNGSQFVITLTPAPWLNDQHVVFGKVLHGWEVLRAMEAFGGPDGQVREAIIVADCGELGIDSKPVQVVHKLDL
eukprot:TRINITY_DN38055_c0_g1_i1.p1 TRINITY_DN38055_c0_g1~~TRINITY_DN38055_c0_g1_i1.p1  ORF type:complete len:392 (+),score=61.74 TRINITY_DN38055_c0_g1_i1:131-1306(+)